MGDLLKEEALRRDCEKAFQDADEEQKGFLTAEDYKVAVVSLLGYKPSKYEIGAVFKPLNSHLLPTEPGRPQLGLDKASFVMLMLRRLKQQDTNELVRQMFLSLDVCCQGFISLQNCKQAFKQVSPHFQDVLIELFFAEVDSNGDGRVSYRDFEIMMKHFQLFSSPGHTRALV